MTSFVRYPRCRRQYGSSSLGQVLMSMRFERFATPDGFTNNYVRDIFEDSEGSIWIGTDSGIPTTENAIA